MLSIIKFGREICLFCLIDDRKAPACPCNGMVTKLVHVEKPTLIFRNCLLVCLIVLVKTSETGGREPFEEYRVTRI